MASYANKQRMGLYFSNATTQDVFRKGYADLESFWRCTELCFGGKPHGAQAGRKFGRCLATGSVYLVSATCNGDGAL